MSDVTLGLRFTADQRELQAASDKGVEAIRRQGDQAKKSNDEARKAAEQHTAALKRQADTLGMSRSQVLAYEAAQHKMTDAQRQSAAASISSIDAYEKKTAILARVRLAAGAAGAALGVAFVAGAKASIAAAAESEQAQLRLEAVLRGTGYAAGFNGDQLDRMAAKMQTRLGINDETIKKSMATLLTFRQVGRESFEDALNVAANISAVMGTDLQSATLQLGKALENPEQGLTALTRSGVSFNDTQKEMIKGLVETGRSAEAITAILQVMKSQGLDNVQESMNTGITGASNALANAWDDLLESFGKTPATGGAVVTAFRGIAAAMNDIRIIAEEGDGIDQFLGYFAAFRGPRAAELRSNKEALAAQDSRELARGGVGASAAALEDQKRVQAARDQVGTFLANFRSDNDKMAEEVRKFRALAANAGLSAEEAAAGEAKIMAKFAKKGSKESTAGAQLILGLTEQLQQASGEATVFDKVMRQVTEGTQKFTDAEIAAALAIAGEIDEMKRAKTERDGYVKAAEAMVKQWEREDAVLAQINESMSAQAQGLQLEIDLMGATDAQREKAITLRELDNKFRKETVDLQDDELERAIQLYNIERERISGLLDQRGAAQARKKAADDAKADQKRFEDEIARGLTDSIFRGFEGGKSFASNFWDSMKNMAKTTILQPVVKFLVSPVTGAIGGALGSLGIPGLANAGAGDNGLGGSLLNQGIGKLLDPVISGVGTSVFGGAGAYASALGLSSSAAGSQAALLAAQTGEFGLAGLAGTASSAGAAGASTLMTALPYVGIALAAASMLGAFGGSKGGPAHFTGLDVSGTAGSGGLLNSQFFGNSANSKRGFRWESHDHGATGGFNQLIQGAFGDVTKLGEMLGLDTSRLSDVTVPFSFRTTAAGNNGAGPTTQEVIDAFGQNLGQLTDQMALTLMPNIREFAQANETLTQTLVRLAEARRAADLNTIFGSMQGALQLADQTRDLWLSDLSPLTAKQRLDEAQGRYGETLAKAQGGDLGAMSQLSGMARTYLGEARGYYASSADYTGIFGDVQAQIGNLVEDTLVEQSIAFSEMNIPLEQIAGNTKDLDKRIAAALEAAIAARGAADDAAMRAQTEALVRANEDLARTLQSFLDARVLT